MSTSLTANIAINQFADSILPPFPVHRFTVDQYFELARLGLLGEEDNCELLEGWIVPKMVKNPLHDNTVDILLSLLNAILPPGWFLRVQNVMQTAMSAPEPDFAVVRGQRGSFPKRHPQGSDVGLVIEVADSSLQIDRRKAETYAAAGVPTYWIINLPERSIEIFSTPQLKAGVIAYATPRVMRAQDDLELILDGHSFGKIAVLDIFPT
jgi:Uma2 family endonuclease